MKPRKADRILKAQDKRFAAIGGATLSGWLESPDRVALVLAACPGAARAAKGRYDGYTTGVNSRLLAKDVGRELRGQRRGPSPDERFDSYLLRKASAGDRGAAELLEKRGGPGADPELPRLARRPCEVRADHARRPRGAGPAGREGPGSARAPRPEGVTVTGLSLSDDDRLALAAAGSRRAPTAT